jgi:hypothetical protein
MKTKALFIVCMLLALGFCLAAASPSTAGISVSTRFYEIIVSADEPGKEQYVEDAGRRPAFTDRGERLCAWNDRDTPKSNRWLILGMKIKGSVGGSYLAYDTSGKDHCVFLSRETMKDGVGTDWTVRLMQNERQLHYHRIQAASGKLKGWDLDIEEYEKEGAHGTATTAYRLVLRKGDAQSKVDIKTLYADLPAR